MSTDAEMLRSRDMRASHVLSNEVCISHAYLFIRTFVAVLLPLQQSRRKSFSPLIPDLCTSPAGHPVPILLSPSSVLVNPLSASTNLLWTIHPAGHASALASQASWSVLLYTAKIADAENTQQSAKRAVSRYDATTTSPGYA